MKTRFATPLFVLLLTLLAIVTSCSKNDPGVASGKPAKHEHKPPHGGTPVVLGNEMYHLELVRDAGTGKLQAYLFDGELEKFIRTSAPSFEVAATVNGAPQTLVFKPVANPVTGETVGDTAQFETQADWLKTTGQFDAVLKSIVIRGRAFTDVKFNFPKGND